MDKRDRVAARFLVLFAVLCLVSVIVSLQLAEMTSDYLMPLEQESLAKLELGTILFMLFGAATIIPSFRFVKRVIKQLPPANENE
jgi:hypothetical protein